MSLRTKVEPIDRDIAVFLNEDLSPAAKSKTLADFAGQAIAEAQQVNRSILGRIPRHRTFVDGREGVQLAAVKPDGVIVAEFELIDDTLKWIADQLVLHSPVLSGRYRKSHTLFADGTEIEVGGIIPNAEEYAFINLVPYARKVERGQSKQAPDGVYQAVATLARQRFGNIAKIMFAYRTAISGSFIGGLLGNKSDLRNPAIIVRVRS